MKFIRDDIRVRDLDARYKRAARWCAMRDVGRCMGPRSWNMATNIPIWDAHTQFEKLYLKGS